MAADRASYAERQAELLGALVAGDDFPAGFDAGNAAAASKALRDKRRRAVARAWPALSVEPGFAERFDAFARSVAAPAAGEALADGLAFARTCDARRLSDQARVECLFARARLRRGPFVGVLVLRAPHRLLVVARILGRRPRAFVLGGRPGL